MHGIKIKFILMVKQIYAVLLGYPPTDFEHAKKTNEETLGNRKFLCCGELTKGVGGGQEPSKLSSTFLINKKLKFQNLWVDNQEVTIYATYLLSKSTILCHIGMFRYYVFI